MFEEDKKKYLVMVVAFSLACKDFRRQFYHSFPACAFIYLDSFKVEISS